MTFHSVKTEKEDPERPVLRCPEQYLTGYINYVVAIPYHTGNYDLKFQNPILKLIGSS
jgi:hypothetical protein